MNKLTRTLHIIILSSIIASHTPIPMQAGGDESFIITTLIALGGAGYYLWDYLHTRNPGGRRLSEVEIEEEEEKVIDISESFELNLEDVGEVLHALAADINEQVVDYTKEIEEEPVGIVPMTIGISEISQYRKDATDKIYKAEDSLRNTQLQLATIMNTLRKIITDNVKPESEAQTRSIINLFAATSREIAITLNALGSASQILEETTNLSVEEEEQRNYIGNSVNSLLTLTKSITKGMDSLTSVVFKLDQEDETSSVIEDSSSNQEGEKQPLFMQHLLKKEKWEKDLEGFVDGTANPSKRDPKVWGRVLPPKKRGGMSWIIKAIDQKSYEEWEKIKNEQEAEVKNRIAKIKAERRKKDKEKDKGKERPFKKMLKKKTINKTEHNN